MVAINEDCRGYASPTQREVLVELAGYSDVNKSFFLTGGTALSVFYLHHRVSDDLDFFTRDPANLDELKFQIRNHWPRDAVLLKHGPRLLSVLIRDVRVDFVIDPLSFAENRERWTFENGNVLSVDTLNNIVTNKFCAVVSRTEPKDLVDLYLLFKKYPQLNLKEVHAQSRLKEALLDDPPTAAFQLESNLAFFQENPRLAPKMLTEYDARDFAAFYRDVAQWLYQQTQW